MGPHRAYRVFRVEALGIDYVPSSTRLLTPRGLAALWAGASFNVEYLVWGALVASLGLSFLQATVVIVVGNLSWVLTGLASLQGPATGTTSFGVSRAIFGPRPNRVLAATNWLTQVGFETYGLSLVVLAGLALDKEAGGHPGVAADWLVVIGAAAFQLVLPWFGHATLASVLKICGGLFGASFVVLAVLLEPKVHLTADWSGASWETLTTAAVIVLSAGGLGWTENASDYSRYLSATVRARTVVIAVAIGGGVPVIVAELMGAALASAVSHPGDISVVSGLPGLFPAWFTIPYLLVVVVQLFAINGLDLYSSGVSLQAAGAPLRRSQCVILDTVICAGLTAWAVFSSSFTAALDDFVQLIVIWIAPWLGVYLTDAALRRGRYDHESLFAASGGRYRRSSGSNRKAVLAQVVGMIAALAWIDSTAYVGPLSRATSGADLSIYVGFASAALTYCLAARRMVSHEVGDHP